MKKNEMTIKNKEVRRRCEVMKKCNKRNDKSKIPACCDACGGPYPLCAGGCPIMDD